MQRYNLSCCKQDPRFISVNRLRTLSLSLKNALSPVSSLVAWALFVVDPCAQKVKMKSFATLVAFAGLLAQLVSAGHYYNVTTETIYTTKYTTVCETPTTFSMMNKTYTVTEPTTVTITDCHPCIVTRTPDKSATPHPPPVEPTTPHESPVKPTAPHPPLNTKPGTISTVVIGTRPPATKPGTAGTISTAGPSANITYTPPAVTSPAPSAVPTAAAYRFGSNLAAVAVAGLALFTL